MSVLDNICYGPLAMGMLKAKARELARAKLTMLGLAGLEQRLPSELSGGQQQRVAVARSLVLEPAVLLFDEPLSNLDAKLRRRVRQEIRELQQSLRLTVLYVTHDQEEALAVSITSSSWRADASRRRARRRSSTKRPRAASWPTSSAMPISSRAKSTVTPEGTALHVGRRERDAAANGVAAGPATLAVRTAPAAHHRRRRGTAQRRMPARGVPRQPRRIRRRPRRGASCSCSTRRPMRRSSGCGGGRGVRSARGGVAAAASLAVMHSA
jgi:iron(III) transport system ATP-binding protein